MIHTLANHSWASFALEFPREKSGKGKSCQSNPDLLPSNPLWVQPWTWTVVPDGADRHLAEASTMDKPFLSTKKMFIAPGLAQGWCSQHPWLKLQLWTVRRAEQQILQCFLPALCKMIPCWEVPYITFFFFNLHCLPSVQHQPITERKLSWNRAQTWCCSDSIALLQPDPGNLPPHEPKQILPYNTGMKPLIRPHLSKYVTCDYTHPRGQCEVLLL